MSVHWWVIAPEARERFDLGNGSCGWHYTHDPDDHDQPKHDPSIERLLEDGLHRDDREAFAAYVLNVWNKGYVEPGGDEYVLDVGRRLYDFCVLRGWKVALDADTDPAVDHFDWPDVDTRYDDPRPCVNCGRTMPPDKLRYIAHATMTYPDVGWICVEADECTEIGQGNATEEE